MNQETLQKIKNMDDFQVLRFFNNLNNSISQQVDVDADQLLEMLPPELQEMDDMQIILKLEEEYDALIDQRNAADFARASLIMMAENEASEQAIAEALENYQDNEMAAATILALGGAVSFILLLSTYKVTYKKGRGWELTGKSKAEIKEVTELVKTLVNGIPEAVLKLIK